jgi:glycosyltransferase involved in cell wall biosynthesis
MTAIIVPAHNEATVITRTLTALLQQVDEHDEVIVVCNGCNDDTADLASTFKPRVTVLVTDVPSKTNALNLGDRHARTFPRIYLDADITLRDGAVKAIVRALTSGQWLAVSPDPIMDFQNASWAVRVYYEIWLSLPYCRKGMIGAGAYALSEKGRARFGDFPNVIADDGYARALFTEDERDRVLDAQSVVQAPATVGWLIKIKTRSRLGGAELAGKFPDLMANENKEYSKAMLALVTSPIKWPKVVVYFYVNLMARLLAKRQFKHLAQYQWERDLSSRAP